MSEIALALPCWAPAFFPEQGRLEMSEEKVNANLNLQRKEEREYSTQCDIQAGKRRGFTCNQSLHISLFFDGTGNNEKNDTASNPPHPTNIAKLYHATYQHGENEGYFRYYMPGVGTPFPEIVELDYSTDGLAFASGGEDRINWGLLQLADALSYTLTNQYLKTEKMKAAIEEMRAHWPISGEVNRRRAFHRFIEPLRSKIKFHRPQLVKVKLFIYGFSRGAAEARTFVNWLTELFDAEGMTLAGLSVSVEFLGLLDTVASVGAAHMLPGATGHMGWAEGTQQLPDEARFPGLIKHCHHYVAAHEQRLCFPLDSIRRPDGSYADYMREVIYPGVHSDVGGGYPPGDQGKSRRNAGELLSQIVLHDMYAAAFAAGAPLAVQPENVTRHMKGALASGIMPQSSIIEFAISPIVAQRFNLWRQTLLQTTLQGAVNQESDHPYGLSQTLESAIREQIGWITAWRIGRYARNSLLVQPFYIEAPQLAAKELEEQEEAHSKAQAEIKKRRRAAAWKPSLPDNSLPGLPDYDPINSQYQLREAAREFQSDYQEWGRDINGDWRHKTKQVVLDTVPKYAVFLVNGDDEQEEYRQMKEDGELRYSALFIDRLGSGIRTSPGAELLAFYDDQIHDSRAWFMQSVLGGRELWGGYFRYRMIYCGDRANKQLQLISVAGEVIGAPSVSKRVVYLVEPQTEYRPETHKVKDLLTGETQTLTPDVQQAYTFAPGRETVQAREVALNNQHQRRLAKINDLKKIWDMV